MSQALINAYRRELAKTRRATGSTNEGVVSEAFKTLLRDWGRQKDLFFAAQHRFTAPDQSQRAADGALLYAGVRLVFGWWEAKDEKDDLDAEIEAKFRVGYPKDNILFTDDRTAVLYQDGRECRRCDMEDDDQLLALLEQFFAYQRPEFAEFAKARSQFRQDLPDVLKALREAILEAEKTKPDYQVAAAAFLEQAKAAINPTVGADDVREMLIQHILTEDIFNQVFDEAGYHRENNVAQALSRLEVTFFTGDLRRRTVERLKSYYSGLKASAARLESRAEKQKLLKDIYEDFYKTYNPKAADRLGVVYTPGEIVRFMIESADWLCEKHFGKTLIHPDVDILDPATGTGTFVVELLEHFQGQKGFKEKYATGLHANEVAILPYYVANLNIEATYKALSGEYAEFDGLCFVDTLDNTAGLKLGKATGELFGTVAEENAERIARQNTRPITLVIGNPPYNANQQNENDNNKNREYREIDKRIKETYIKASTAQKTKLYDMYARFFRWASDRIEDDGMVVFITNRSFLDSRTFDGFRKVVGEEFNEIWVVDLGGDVRANPKISGTKHNVFGIQTGVAISFLVKKKGVHGCRIFYARRPELETAAEKLAWLGSAQLANLGAEQVHPNAANTWLRQGRSDFGTLIPVASKEAKATKHRASEQAVFKLFSLGAVTNRDDWVYAHSRAELTQKLNAQLAAYKQALTEARKRPAAPIEEFLVEGVKWTRALKARLRKRVSLKVGPSDIRPTLYRPYFKQLMVFSPDLNEFQYQTPQMWPKPDTRNPAICFNVGGRLPFTAFGVDIVPSLTTLSLDGNQCLSRYRYAGGQRLDNITDWALDQFAAAYPTIKVSKDDIFAYIYGVLHDPAYRETYALNLRREFPRIPFYADFTQWRDWGETLLDLHIGYEAVQGFGLERVETPLKRGRAMKAGESLDLLDTSEPVAPKPKLKSHPDEGVIELDAATSLTGVPAAAWRYRLGNRSAIDWVLDQHKEKKISDPTVAAKFNTYRFADHKERVIDLLDRVVAVSVETVAITDKMSALPASAREQKKVAS